MAYNKLIDLNLLSNFLSKIKSLIPTKTSDLENDSEYITGMEILSYGNSTWNDFLTAYTTKKVVYCRASSNSNPASGSQTRLAFMAYVNNADNPTNVEFQYYRSVSSHTSTQQGDQVFVYKLDKTSGWSVTTREASSKVVAGTNMTSSYSNDTVTLNANIPSNVSDLTNDSGYITGITSSDVTTALGYTPSSTDTTYSAGNGIDITNTIIKNTQGIEYIVGTQIASTAAWTGNSTDEALYIGKIIAYYLPFAGTSTAATLTLTMGNGATTEAIPLRRVGSSTVTTQFAAGNIIVLIYDGTYWRVSAYHNSSDTNTIPTGYCTTGASTAAKSANCTYGYRDDTNYFPCLFRYANTAANATLAIASYATTALPIYVNGERTSATNTFGAGVILFLYYNGAYYCYNDGRLPILVNGVVTSVQDYTNELKNTINEVSQVITSTNIDSTSIATFDASAANMPLKGLTVNIEPVQDLHGYDHPWPEGGGKNLLKYPYETGTVTKNGVTFTVYNDGSIKVDTAGAAATANADLYFFSSTGSLPLSNGDYIFSSTYDGTLPSDGFYIHAKANASDASYLNISIGDEGLYTVSNGVFYTACIRVLSGRTINNVTVRPMLRLATEADATFEPYSNICPISGWTGCNIVATKNIFDIDNATFVHGYLIAADGTITENSRYKYCSNYTPIIGGSKITVSGTRTSVAAAFGTPISFYDDQKTFLSRISTFLANGVSGYVQATIDVPDGAAYFRLNFYDVTTPVSDFQIEYGDTATDFSPFSSFEVTFPSEAGTVYGGTLDVVNRTLTVNKVAKIFTGTETFNTDIVNGIGYITNPIGAHNGTGGSTTVSFLVCSHLNPSLSYLDSSTVDRTNKVWPWFNASKLYILLGYTSGVTSASEYISYLQQQYAAGTPVTVCYLLDTPIVYDLTADEITTLLGTNNIWANTGDITVTYGAYLETVKAYIDQSIAEQDLVNDAQDERIADLEQTTTATAINPSAIATFEASTANMPLKELTINIEPVQDFNGYDSPWPGGSRKNLLNIDDLIAAPSGTFGGYTFKHKLTLIVSPNTQYTLSTSYNDTGNVLYFNGTSGSGNCVKADAPKTFQSSETGELTILLYDRDGISSFENKTVTVQLEEGSTATIYEPYENICPIGGWTGCNVTQTGKNLFDIPSGTLKVGTINKNTGVIDTSASTSRYTENMLKIKGGANYAFQCVFSGSPQADLYMAYYDSNGMFLERVVLIPAVQAVAGAWSGVVQMRDDASYIRLCGYVGVFTYSSNRQIEEGNEITDYEPYQGTTHDITFPDSAGTIYGGTLDVVNKKLTVAHQAVTFNGSESGWADFTVGTVGNRVQWNTYNNIGIPNAEFLCDKFSAENPSDTHTVYSIYGSAAAARMFFSIPATITSLQEWKDWLSENNVTVVYPIATPIVYDLTDVPEIITLLGENNIWADCGDVTVIYGEYLTQIKNNINNLDKHVKIIEDDDPLFDKLIHLPDDDSFFDKQGITTLGTYTKIDKHTFKISGGSGTAYYSYPLHGTNKVIWGTNTQMLTRLTPSDFAPIPASGSWGNTTYSVGMRVYSETNTTNSNRNLEIDLWAANIQNDEFIGEPIVVASCIPANYTKYCTTILRLRGTGFGPLSQYTHYAIFARSRSRASSAEAIIRLETVQSPRLMQYILYPTSAIETSLVTTTSHAPNTFILNNDKLYKVLTQIQSGEEIVIGTNVEQVSILEALTNLLNSTENIPNTSSISNTGLISIKHDSTELFTIQLPLYNGGVSNGT